MSKIWLFCKTVVVVYGAPVFWFFLAMWLLDASKMEAFTFAAALWALGLHFELSQRVDLLFRR